MEEERFWISKICAYLNNPMLRVSDDQIRESLANSNVSEISGWVRTADAIAAASDRASLRRGNFPTGGAGTELEISHLLSGAKQTLSGTTPILSATGRSETEKKLQEIVAEASSNDLATLKKNFWWLWRCLPVYMCEQFNSSMLLLPTETYLPDASIWSHASLASALAGALAGDEHPHLASFTFTPVQELIKASRKMRDFWAGSWLLHYLSAKICWQLAQKYGPDCLLYPSLFQQPLIDHWILQCYPDFSSWVNQPTGHQLLTSGFPNVIMAIVPKDKVAEAMTTAYNTLIQTWESLGQLVFTNLQGRGWMSGLSENHKTWGGWLHAQWQHYWVSCPIGLENDQLIYPVNDNDSNFEEWRDRLNEAYITGDDRRLFPEAEQNILAEANVGSWWPYIFDKTRFMLAAVKNARTWEIPTAFGPRSTISGMGPVVHPVVDPDKPDWVTETKTRELWGIQAGLFDGSEQLNATETLKRGLHKVLLEILPPLSLTESEAGAAYPDLTAGVAGYLKVNEEYPAHLQYFRQVCNKVRNYLERINVNIQKAEKWGIPWIDDQKSQDYEGYHPRLLNAGWSVEDLIINDPILGLPKGSEEREIKKREYIQKKKREYRQGIQKILDREYGDNNPASWYVLVAGDGDGMSDWLKGNKMKEYNEYVASSVKANTQLDPHVREFIDNTKKRMGPATHNALSRALLDFSNQLLPYLTEERYACRLIYGGGDDVLAYANLWEWDSWLWDVRECFRGQEDPKKEFSVDGDYWRWREKEKLPENIDDRPLFTMGREATISFGIVIAHHSVPVAIALENMWSAEKKAKEHKSRNQEDKKDAVQVRVIYGNGNILTSTTKFEVFDKWRSLLDSNVESSIFEQAATLWSQHPAPAVEGAIACWTGVFCERREIFQGKEDSKKEFQRKLEEFITALGESTEEEKMDVELQNWLKLAAFTIRKRKIKID